jgi:hypothetical protein
MLVDWEIQSQRFYTIAKGTKNYDLKKISVCHKAGSTFSINASPNRGPFAYFQDLMDIVRSTIDNT